MKIENITLLDIYKTKNLSKSDYQPSLLVKYVFKNVHFVSCRIPWLIPTDNQKWMESYA